MKTTRRKFSAGFKAQVAIEALKKWEQEFIEHGAEVFEKKKESGNEIDVDKLYSKIGELEMEKTF